MSHKTETQPETTTTAKTRSGWKVTILVVVAIILLQAFWNMTEGKIAESMTAVTTEIESLRTELKSGLTGLDARIAAAEQGILGIEAIKADAAAANKAAKSFEGKLSALIQAEELKLAGLEKDAANQKAYIDQIKSLLEGLPE